MSQHQEKREPRNATHWLTAAFADSAPEHIRTAAVSEIRTVIAQAAGSPPRVAKRLGVGVATLYRILGRAGLLSALYDARQAGLR